MGALADGEVATRLPAKDLERARACADLPTRLRRHLHPNRVMSRGIVGQRATYFYLAFWIVFAIAAGAAYGLVVS